MTLYEATAIAEGFSGTVHTVDEVLEAWAYLIETGHCWQLQGWFGRQAMSFIEDGVISKEGKINWETVAELYS